MQANPLWPVQTRRPDLQDDLDVDVLVVGGGMAGMSCATQLKLAGREVALIERNEIGGPATGASSGVLYYGSGTNYVPAVKLFGQKNAALLWRETARVISEVKRTASEGKIECGARSCGAIMVAQTEEELSELDEEHSGLEKLGLPAKLLSPDEIRTHYPKVGFLGGLSFDDVGQVHPALLASGIAGLEGLQIYENTPSLGWEEGPDAVTVKTPKGQIECANLVVATNLEPFLGLENHFDTEGSVILASSPTDKVKEVFPEEKILWTMAEKYDIVYPRGDRLMLELYSLGDEEDKLKRYFPGIDFQTDQIWGENWSKPRDWMPIVGKVSKRTAAAIGMGDQGIIISWLSGKKMPGILEGKVDWFTKMTSPQRFGPGVGVLQ
jgi:glycine/D-amino acid oxidase-like deaminating enzyme